MRSLEARLAEAAASSIALPAWRAAALELVREALPFEAALFHELSPRAPLEGGALIGIDAEALVATRASWDENAVVLGRLRDLALEQGGVALDHEAFARGSRARREWDRRVARPLGLRSIAVAHLVVRDRIASVMMLARRRLPAFEAREREAIAALLPVIAIGDALQQALVRGAVHGPARELACVDQRLTERQREIVLGVALGHTNEEIGRALGISDNTVRNLLVRIRARLGAANRAEIVRLAVLR